MSFPIPSPNLNPRRQGAEKDKAMSRAILSAAVALALVGSLSACEPGGPPESAAYSRGWVEGCNSGYADAGRGFYHSASRLDRDRREADPDYRKGWDAAYKKCFDEEQRTPYTWSALGIHGRTEGDVTVRFEVLRSGVQGPLPLNSN